MKPYSFIASLLLALVLLVPIEGTEAQFLKKLGKKTRKAAERGVENTIERKTRQKAEEKTDQAIETVFGIPKKATQKDGDQSKTDSTKLKGTWYYESIEGLPGYETLNDCNKKSNIAYSDGSYHTQFYDADCNLLTNSVGTYELNGKEMTVYAENKEGPSTTKITTTQRILEHTETKLVIEDAMSGAVVTLVKKQE